MKRRSSAGGKPRRKAAGLKRRDAPKAAGHAPSVDGSKVTKVVSEGYAQDYLGGMQ
jgi:hypothetical protein